MPDPRVAEFRLGALTQMLRDEHIGGRKDWGRYTDTMVPLRYERIAQVRFFCAEMRWRLREARAVSVLA